MSRKTKPTKAKTKKENLAALGLPALWERFKEATGDTTKSPNKKFLVRRIEEALAARAAGARARDSARRERAAEAARSVHVDDDRGAADEAPRGLRALARPRRVASTSARARRASATASRWM